MSGLSTYLTGKLLAWLAATNMPTAPAAVYVALYNGNPTDAGTSGTDVTTTIRTAGRVACTWGTPSGKSVSNSADVDFGNAVSAATVTHFGIWDAATGGNMLGSSPLSTSRAVTSGTPVKFAIGDLTWSFA